MQQCTLEDIRLVVLPHDIHTGCQGCSAADSTMIPSGHGMHGVPTNLAIYSFSTLHCLPGTSNSGMQLLTVTIE